MTQSQPLRKVPSLLISIPDLLCVSIRNSRVCCTIDLYSANEAFLVIELCSRFLALAWAISALRSLDMRVRVDCSSSLRTGSPEADAATWLLPLPPLLLLLLVLVLVLLWRRHPLARAGQPRPDGEPAEFALQCVPPLPAAKRFPLLHATQDGLLLSRREAYLHLGSQHYALA